MEKEICLRSLVPFDELKRIMFEKGFEIQEDFQMNDIYMIKDDVEISLKNQEKIFKDNVLVRETVGKRVLLVNKIKNIKDGNVISEKKIKCQISNKLDGYNFLKSIGYKKVFELKDHNLLLTNKVNEIYLQDVEDLGCYIEMESKNLKIDKSNGDSLEELVNNIRKYNLPLDYTNISAKKSLDLLKTILAN